jgi:hypothetical protein
LLPLLKFLSLLGKVSRLWYARPLHCIWWQSLEAEFPFSSRLRSSRHSQISKRLLPQLQIYHRQRQATPASIIRSCIYLTLRARLECNESFTGDSRETTSLACCCRYPTTFIRQGSATRILEAKTTTAPLPLLLALLSERVGPCSYLISVSND